MSLRRAALVTVVADAPQRTVHQFRAATCMRLHKKKSPGCCPGSTAAVGMESVSASAPPP